MIFMLNGPFGVGKSTVAQLLCERLSNAMIYDPEIIGSALRKLTEGVRDGVEDTDDFQDIVLWPLLTVQLAKEMWEQYKRHLIIPMTIVNPVYFTAIKEGLSKITSPLHHFCLIASPATVHSRLSDRGDDTSGWAWNKSQHYIPQFNHQRFQTHINTENLTPEAVAEIILKQVNLL